MKKLIFAMTLAFFLRAFSLANATGTTSSGGQLLTQPVAKAAKASKASHRHKKKHAKKHAKKKHHKKRKKHKKVTKKLKRKHEQQG